MSLYRVTGPRMYRSHPTGETFEARLEPDAERRAIARGAIELLHEGPPTIQPGSYRLPVGWVTMKEEASDE